MKGSSFAIFLILLVLLPTSGIASEKDLQNALRVVYQGNKEELLKLLDNGVPIDTPGWYTYSLLETAVQQRHQDIVLLLLERGANPKPRPSRQSPLLYAVLNDDASMVKILLDHGADPNEWGSNGSPLIYAARGGCYQAAKVLMEGGATPKTRTAEGRNAVEEAHRTNHVKLAMMLAGVNNEEELPALLNKWRQARKRLHELGEDFRSPEAFQLAASQGRRETVELFLESGMEPDVGSFRDPDQTPLVGAVGSGHREIVDLLLKNGAGKRLIPGKTYTSLSVALGRAASIGDVAVVRMLLDLGADPNAPIWLPAMNWAVQAGHIEIAKLLLERGAKVDLPNREGRTALSIAVSAGRADMVRLLLKNGATIPDPSQDQQILKNYTLLMVSARQGYTEIARLLIEHGQDVNARTPDGDTALIIAAGQGRTDVARLLIEKGAKINVQNNTGVTPLLAASSTKRPELVALLKAGGVESNVNLDLVDAITANDADKIKALLAAGADANFTLRGDNGKDSAPPLLMATEKQNLEIVKLLLDKGANPNLANEAGVTSLTKAVELNNLDLVTSLLAKGADPNKDFDARQQVSVLSPLHLAAANGNVLIVSALIRAGTNVNQQMLVAIEDAGSTPLMVAVRKGHIEIVRMLIKEKADVNLTNYAGTGPLTIAKSMKNAEAIKILERAGARDRYKGQ